MKQLNILQNIGKAEAAFRFPAGIFGGKLGKNSSYWCQLTRVIRQKFPPNLVPVRAKETLPMRGENSDHASWVFYAYTPLIPTSAW